MLNEKSKKRKKPKKKNAKHKLEKKRSLLQRITSIGQNDKFTGEIAIIN